MKPDIQSLFAKNFRVSAGRLLVPANIILKGLSRRQDF
jgi:hypothetical protein